MIIVPPPNYIYDTSGGSGYGGCQCRCVPPDPIDCGNGCPPLDMSRYHVRLNRIRATDNPDCLIDFDTSAIPEFKLDGESGNTVGVIPPAIASFPSKIPGGALANYQFFNACGVLNISTWFAYIYCTCSDPIDGLRYTLQFRFGTSPAGFTPNFACPLCPAGIISRAFIIFSVPCSDECDFDTILGDYEVNLVDGTFGSHYTLDFTVYKT
jgi:hypothetical protein